MMNKFFRKLAKLAGKRIDFFYSGNYKGGWYKGSETYFNQIEEELEEARAEINTNKVFLEDELGDVLRDYLCLIKSLQKEGKISSFEKVLQRAWKKYSERINKKDGKNNGDWLKIKERQKKELKLEVEK